MSHTTSAISESIHLFFVDIEAFSGKVSLNAADLGLDVSQLPPGVVNLGSKNIVSPKELNGFTTTRAQVHRVCMENGTKYRKGVYMIPDSRFKFVVEEIEKSSQRYETFKTRFVRDFQSHVELWAEKIAITSPEWADKIRLNTPTIKDIESRIRFDVPVVALAIPRSIEGVDIGDGGLSRKLSGMAQQISEEVSSDASLWEAKDGAQASGLRKRLERILNKLNSLSFLDSSGKINRIAELITSFLPHIPIKGKIEGDVYLTVYGLMSLLQNPERLMSDMPFPSPSEAVETVEVEAVDIVEVDIVEVDIVEAVEVDLSLFSEAEREILMADASNSDSSDSEELSFVW